MNGAFFQFLGRFQVTIEKYGFSQLSETDVVEMKIRFGIFHHYWITMWESQTILPVHFIIGLKPFSRMVYHGGGGAVFSNILGQSESRSDSVIRTLRNVGSAEEY